MLALIDRVPGVTDEQKSTLHKCDPPPTDAARPATVRQCLIILNGLQQSAAEAAVDVSNAQIAGDTVDKILAHRQSLFTFWLQAAQLILLNLLLPLLTALFGYIFGSQQAGRSP